MRTYFQALFESLPLSRPTYDRRIDQDAVPTQPGSLHTDNLAFDNEVKLVMQQLRIEEPQARRHVQCRRELRAAMPKGLR